MAVAEGARLKTQFPSSEIGQTLQTIASILAGRSVLSANRQLFHCQQDLYDTHSTQLDLQQELLGEFDAGIGAFFEALEELGLSNQVLVCTHSDFGRTMQGNTAGGSDHGWGNHQLILGGGIRGGRIIGSFPDLDLGGADDLNDQGVWIPSTSVTQMTAALGGWMGLSTAQVASAFPDLVNFASGPIQLF